MPLQNRVTPFGELIADASARSVSGQSRRALPYRCEDADRAALGVAAMDLLRARFQGPPTRRLGPLLYRAVLSRRGDRARGRPSAVLRMPPQRGGSFRRRLARGAKLRAPPHAGEMDEVLHRRAPRRPRQAAAPACHRRIARRRIRRAGGGAPSPSAATRCCAGRRTATRCASRGRGTAVSMCSRRRRSSRFCRPATDRIGIRSADSLTFMAAVPG